MLNKWKESLSNVLVSKEMQCGGFMALKGGRVASAKSQATPSGDDDSIESTMHSGCCSFFFII